MTQFLVGGFIAVGAVVDARNVEHLCKTRGDGVVDAVHARCDGTGRVEEMNKVLHLARHAVPLLGPLLRNLIADGPHHDGGVEAVGHNKVLEVAAPPILIETGVAILAFGPFPHVETLSHHHHAKGIIHLHLHL